MSTGPTNAHNTTSKYLGFYRARVVEVDIEDDDGEKNTFGSVRVFIPTLMNKDIDSSMDEFTNGIVAYPANNNIGGYNEDDPDETSFYTSTVSVPCKNSYVWVFFENGDTSRVYYFNAVNNKISKLPPENRGVESPHKVYTIIKTGSGRAIIVSDSEDQQRVEITGKKRKLDNSEGPQGNAASVYEIDGNQTTILLDEIDGKEKILIRSHKGDYINFNIEDQTLECQFKSDIKIKTEGRLSIESKGIDIKSNDDIAIEAKSNLHLKSGMSVYILSEIANHIKSSGKNLIDATKTLIQLGLACKARGSSPDSPKGDR